MTSSISRFIAIAPVTFLLAGCDDTPTNETAPPMRTAKSVEPAKNDSSAAKKDAAGTTERMIGGATFQIPNAWREEQLENVGFKVIDADFRIDGEAGEARLTLSSAKGGVAENIDRWKGQFQRGPNDPEPRESSLTVAGRDATLVELFGTFRDSSRGRDPQPNSAMLGIVIPLTGTNYFIKVTGPRQTVLDAKDAILKLVESSRFRE